MIGEARPVSHARREIAGDRRTRHLTHTPREVRRLYLVLIVAPLTAGKIATVRS